MEKSTEKPRRRTRCYYTDYVNHAIRFYLTCPESIKLEGKRRADVANWVAVQSAFHSLPKFEQDLISTVYRKNHNLVVAVETYCNETGTDADVVWKMITKVSSLVARRRGLI